MHEFRDRFVVKLVEDQNKETGKLRNLDCVFCGTGGFEHRVPNSITPVHFVLFILKIGSLKLFAWAGLVL
jgi:hypothetical protein